MLDKADPGADVQGRFSYQHCYAAIQCLRLIDGKLEAVFCENLEDNLLVSSGGASADVLPPGFDVMVEKLEGGGLQMARVGLLKDYKASLETMYMKWLHRDGATVANQRLEHIRAFSP